MTKDLDEPTITRTTEVQDRLTDAACFGDKAAELAIGWLQPWWKQCGLPERDNGFPACPGDVLLHAGAVAMIAKYEWYGFGESLDSHLPSSEEAMRGFLDRLASFDTEVGVGDAGARLIHRVHQFHQSFFAPLTQGVALVGEEPDEDGIECLANLLMDYRDVLDEETDHDN